MNKIIILLMLMVASCNPKFNNDKKIENCIVHTVYSKWSYTWRGYSYIKYGWKYRYHYSFVYTNVYTGQNYYKVVKCLK